MNPSRFFLKAIMLPAMLGAAMPALTWHTAAAQDAQTSLLQPPQTSAASPAADPSLATSLPEPFHSWNGLRPKLAAHGVTLQINQTSDIQANVNGGLRRGKGFIGLFEAVFDVDLEKAVGWKGGKFHANAFQIMGHGITQCCVGSFQATSGLEALPATRLDEIWIEQALSDWASVRVGKLAADTDFFTTPFHALGVSGAFGWPAALSTNLPNGGPGYPFAAPGIRVSITPSENVTLLGAIFDGHPVGAGPGDAQKRNHNGLNFRLKDPPFVISEAQFRYGLGANGAFPGGLRVGGWAQFGKVADSRVDADHILLASPSSIGTPMYYRGEYGVYAAFDQQIIRGPDTGKGVFIYGRAAFSPPDRSVVDAYVDAGVSVIGMWPARPNDQFGLMAAWSHMSARLRASHRDLRYIKDEVTSLPSHEAIVEASYQAQIVEGWSVQPHVQYVFNPGGGLHNPDTNGKIKNATIVGVRSIIKY